LQITIGIRTKQLVQHLNFFRSRRFADHDRAKNSPPAKRGRRSAERRMPTMSAHTDRCRHLQMLEARLRANSGRARLPAPHRGTRHRLSPRWLSPRTGFPQGTAHKVFCPFAANASS
jgi:hypothetical protein